MQPQSSVPPTYGAPAEANLAYERADLELDRRADHGAQPGGDRPLLSAIRVWGGWRTGWREGPRSRLPIAQLPQ
jgi:hypothetical protein